MNEPQLKSEPIEWCEDAESMLSSATHNCTIDDLRQQVEYGASLFKLTADDVLVGYYILRIDHLKYWSEGVYVAGAGKHTDFDLPELSVLIAERQFKGCKYFRIHTARPGVVRKLVKLGYKPQEFILMKEIE